MITSFTSCSLVDTVQAFAGLLLEKTIYPNRRYAILNHLQYARSIHRRRAHDRVLGTLEDWVLVKPTLPRDEEVKLDRQINFDEWLGYVRKGKFIPAVYFPSNFAGPDIVFFIGQKHSSRKILVALQVSVH